MSKRIQIIVNPAAGKDRPVLSDFNTAFQDADIAWDVSITKGAGDARSMADQAVADKVDIVGVYGGDGTITEVASALLNTEIPLAIFPGGTANAIALALGIPTDLAAACAMVVNHEANEVRILDIGEIGDSHFLIAIGIGLAGKLAETADRDAKDRLGPLAYALSSIQALRQSEVAKYHLTLDGREIDTEGVTCIIANSGNFGVPGVSLAPNIDMTDGLLDVVVIPSAALGSIVSVAANIVRPAASDDEAPFERWQAREVTAVADPPQAIQADGEVLDPGPVHARVLQRALRVLVPTTPAS
jgi:diacylglycerol kinase (ATP)